ncbi:MULTISPECIES: hypothetical protein [unclassified Archaeoglobus]|jgi:hypothetical protein|uniref:hypothetical protein n=1 Tax=unclassified Archaeoglobus TaxID=2643606 RepID=UPI0025C60ACB|nr:MULTISPECIES: hypothetical protein [unclassified Archaeoglobus]
MSEKRVLSLRVVMDKELEEKFSEIKKELGLASNAEVVRFLVNRFYKELVNKGGIMGILCNLAYSLAASDIPISEISAAIS